MDEHQERIQGYVKKWTEVPAVKDALHGSRDRQSWSRELIKAIAADIGADMVAYIEVQYPEAIAATSSTFKTSVRNHIYNQVMAAIEITDADQIEAWLKDRKKHRRELVAAYRKLRRTSRVSNGHLGTHNGD